MSTCGVIMIICSILTIAVIVIFCLEWFKVTDFINFVPFVTCGDGTTLDEETSVCLVPVATTTPSPSTPPPTVICTPEEEEAKLC